MSPQSRPPRRLPFAVAEEAVIPLVLVYVTSAWGEVYATIEDAKRGCDDYLRRCYSHAEPHVEDGTDAEGWFQLGEPPSLREWRRFFTDFDHADPLHFPPQSIRERVLHGDLTSVLPPAESGAP